MGRCKKLGSLANFRCSGLGILHFCSSWLTASNRCSSSSDDQVGLLHMRKGAALGYEAGKPPDPRELVDEAK